MRMELQGKKATHDFLSLYSSSSFPQPEPRSSSLPQGFLLKTYDFLRPLERPSPSAVACGGDAVSSIDAAASVEHMLPGGIGTYSISNVAVVKAEQRPQTPASASSGAFTLWEEPDAGEAAAGSQGQWPRRPSSCARGSASSVSLPAPRQYRSSLWASSQERIRPMQSLCSTPMRGLEDEDDEDDGSELGKREAISLPFGELLVKVDGKGRVQKRRPSTPRSKHSATEQRRRSKINDRFQILRELIPRSDQKRDKASFLLEVIEYIRFLQEKVEKYDSVCPPWGQENGKSIPWRDNQVFGIGARDPSQAVKNNIAASRFIFSGNDNNTSVRPVMPVEFDVSAGGPYEVPDFLTKEAARSASVEANMYASSAREISFNQLQQNLIADSDNRPSESQDQWQRSPGPKPCRVISQTNDHEQLMIDEGTINVSNVYSQGLLIKLSQALHSSGLDLSGANISVQISLGKRGIRRPAAYTPISSAKGSR